MKIMKNQRKMNKLIKKKMKKNHHKIKLIFQIKQKKIKLFLKNINTQSLN